MTSLSELSAYSLKDQVSEQEWQLRCDLAMYCRIVAAYGWDDDIYSHTSIRLPGTEHFLLNPYGVFYEEMTASDIIKVDCEGNLVGETRHMSNPAGFIVHSTFHRSRDKNHVVMHLHTREGIAVSCCKEGLLPISQHAMIPLTSLGYHDYEGIIVQDGERERLQADIGDKKCLILRNHGLLTVGETIADAYMYMYFLQKACEVQVSSLSMGQTINPIKERVLATVPEQVARVTRGQGGNISWQAHRRLAQTKYPECFM